MRTLKQEIYFPIIVGIHFIFWAIDLFFYSGSFMEVSSDTLLFGELTNQSWFNIHRILGEVFSSWVVTVFAFNFLMVTRVKWIEQIFGGLDKMYLIHRRSGVIAVVLLIAHFIFVPRDLTAFTPGKPMGFYAFILIMIGVLLSAAPIFKRKIPYHKWINIHKLMGGFYILGVVHGLMVNSLIQELPITRVYVFGMALVGIMAWFYRAFLFRFFNKKFEYQVVSIKDKKFGISEILLQPVSSKIDFIAGQFAFFTLPKISKKEQHPFTISNHPNNEELRITVKGLGDYTDHLSSKIKSGDTAFVEGPYGYFTANRIKEVEQIWVAGGIGITPFLSLAGNTLANKTHLYWCVNDTEEAVYRDELSALALGNPNFTFTIWPSNELGYLTAEKFALDNYKNKGYLICGPKSLKENIIKQLHSLDIKKEAIYDEEFAFR